MSLFMVTTGWQGNGTETVLLEADSAEAAIDQAVEFLLKETWLPANGPVPAWAIKHRQQRIDSYTSRDGMEATEITLPWIGETG